MPNTPVEEASVFEDRAKALFPHMYEKVGPFLRLLFDISFADILFSELDCHCRCGLPFSSLPPCMILIGSRNAAMGISPSQSLNKSLEQDEC